MPGCPDVGPGRKLEPQGDGRSSAAPGRSCALTGRSPAVLQRRTADRGSGAYGPWRSACSARSPARVRRRVRNVAYTPERETIRSCARTAGAGCKVCPGTWTCVHDHDTDVFRKLSPTQPARNHGPPGNRRSTHRGLDLRHDPLSIQMVRSRVRDLCECSRRAIAPIAIGTLMSSGGDVPARALATRFHRPSRGES